MTTQKSWRRRTRTHILLLAAFVLGIFGILELIKQQTIADSRVTATFEKSATSNTAKLDLELALTEPQRERGLMYRKSLADFEGMLFVFPESKVQRFWMKNTFIPLDMVFIDEKLMVVGIVEDVAPFTLEPRGVDKKSQYVVELFGGSARKLGITEGAILRPQKPIPRGK